MCAGLLVQASVSFGQVVDPVVQWNRVLLTIVRTAGAQPATIHPTRKIAIMHLAMWDAVSAPERAPGTSPFSSVVERKPM